MPGIGHLVLYKSIALVFIFAAIQLFAQNHPNPKIDSLLQNGIEKLLHQNYKSAEVVFNKLKIEFPKNPLGHIYLTAAKIARAVDYEEKLNEHQLDSLLTIAKTQADDLLDFDDKSLWNNYYDALIYGYRAYYNSVNSNLISAFADGVLSLHSFQHCLEIDNDFNEALIAIGIYKYWKSAQTKSLNWIPFVKDEREEGIAILESAITHDSYNQYLAVHSLIWIYIDNGESEKAIELSKKMLSKYSDSRFFRWGLARAYEDIDKVKAIEIYHEILISIEQISNRNFFNDIVLKHKMAMLYNDLGDYNQSNQLCDEILNSKIKSNEIKLRLEDRFERVINLKEELNEKLENNN
ncbi:MAG: hypothetical protein H6613_11970 [Ignavibacteriales bacterium]|nr:hypothetical protein [Ignavibacteriales bacterium]